MIRLLTWNWHLKLAALAIAVLLWISVAREPELVTSLAAPIEFKNMPSDLDFGADVPERVNLELRGQSGRLSRESLSDVGVILDLSDARTGERTYTIRANNMNLPSGVLFDRAIPTQITLRFERLLTKQVPVKALYVKTPGDYRVKSDIIEPPRIEIRGPEERVKGIDQVMTDPLDLSGVVSSKEFHTQVNVGDPQVRMESPNKIAVRVNSRETALPRLEIGAARPFRHGRDSSCCRQLPAGP